MMLNVVILLFLCFGLVACFVSLALGLCLLADFLWKRIRRKP